MTGTIAPIDATQPIAEAVRVLLGQQLAELQVQETRYWAGERKDGVHRMRVALRRMRALLRLFGDCFTSGTVKALSRGTRQAARTLGKLRDLDVFTGHLRSHQQTLPEADQGEIDDLVRTWRKRRQRARREVEAYLRSKRYRKLVTLLAEFVATPGQGVLEPDSPHAPLEVRHVLGGRLWQRYEHVWAFGPLLDGASMETLHELRIECKYLRYALEFFQPVLEEPRTTRAIGQVVALQDSLGTMHDAAVAGEMLGGKGKNPGRERYLAERQSAAEVHLAAFPALWARVDNLRFRRDLAAMLANL